MFFGRAVGMPLNWATARPRSRARFHLRWVEALLFELDTDEAAAMVGPVLGKAALFERRDEYRLRLHFLAGAGGELRPGLIKVAGVGPQRGVADLDIAGLR